MLLPKFPDVVACTHVVLDGEIVSYSERAHSTFYDRNEALGGEAFREHFHADEIIRYNLGGTFDGIAPPATVAGESAARWSIVLRE